MLKTADSMLVVDEVSDDSSATFSGLIKGIDYFSETKTECCEKSHLSDAMPEVLSANPEQSYCFLNEGFLRERVRFLKDNFLPNDSRARVTYAVKANPRSRILSILESEDIDGFDCASLGEICKAIASANVDSSGLYFNNPIRTDRATEMAIESGVSYFTAHCREGINQVLNALGPKTLKYTDMAVRLETSNDDAAISLSSKFGCLPEEAVSHLRYIDQIGMKKGLTMHVGSQNLNPESYFSSLKVLRDVAIEAGGVSSVNLGGGLPVDYEGPNRIDLAHYLSAINGAVHTLTQGIFTRDEADPEIIIEPGRAMIAEAVDLAIPVLGIHERRGEKRLYIGDGVYTSFSDSKIHNWPYYFRHLRMDGRDPSSSSSTYTVHGRTCDGGDTLGEIELPHGIKKGDFLHVKNAGAYLDSQSTYFNGFEPPKYVSYNV